jgi:hypothetical protein
MNNERHIADRQNQWVARLSFSLTVAERSRRKRESTTSKLLAVTFENSNVCRTLFDSNLLSSSVTQRRRRRGRGRKKKSQSRAYRGTGRRRRSPNGNHRLLRNSRVPLCIIIPKQKRQSEGGFDVNLCIAN